MLGQLNYVLYFIHFFSSIETKHKILCLIPACSKSTEKRIERIIENPHLSTVLSLGFFSEKGLRISLCTQESRRQGDNETKAADQN